MVVVLGCRKLMDAGFFHLLEALLAKFPTSTLVQGGVGSLVYALAGDPAMKRSVVAFGFV